MFIYSVRASSVRFAALIILVLALLVSVITVGAEDSVYASGESEINYGGMKTREDRIAFIKQFGIEVDGESEKSEKYRLPENFDRVISGYNQLQISQGLNLTKYAKKRITHYAYKVTNAAKEGEVYVNLLVYRQKIIACDVSSLEENGFVLPLTEAKEVVRAE